MPVIAFIDAEVDPTNGKVLDIGGIRSDGPIFHGSSIADFTVFIQGAEYVCGHNILKHDSIYLKDPLDKAGLSRDKTIDTLFLSPMLFPKKPYHKLLKDDKLQVDELNNPLNDSIKARDLFYDEIAAFSRLDDKLKTIYWSLLKDKEEFKAFFRYIGYKGNFTPQQSQPAIRGLLSIFKRDVPQYDGETVAACNLIRNSFKNVICSNTNLEQILKEDTIALAYCLALISAIEDDKSVHSITPPWVLHNYPQVEQIMFRLRNTPCLEGCPYCNRFLETHAALKRWFGFSSFRSYGGEPLQEKAVWTAVENQSLLAVFPTGGGKSLAFQLPALIAGENTGALTVVISPLQSLMKDQVDNLEKKGITESATINGLLDPIERAKAFERVENGTCFLLYISPESLRSKSIEKLILSRKIARFVIDEAHCFSSWGQDFRVDYLYIADFIKTIQEKKNLQWNIPVSCFTATAKPQVIEDIRKYFKDKLFLDLKLFSASVSRTNLRYTVLPEADDEAKYQALRRLLEERECPAIVYVTRTRKAEELARRLEQDGFSARPYHGKMDPDTKIRNQNEFMAGQIRIIVATSAFGMGVDKSDVGLVIHYQISDSLENYVQEAGRAGRDENIEADCYVLFNEEDLSKHFILLNQTKITIKEIQQIWQAVKSLSKFRSSFSASALEIARLAGWDDSVSDIETRVKTAIASLEQAGYLKRGQNMPRVYATGILVKTAQDAIDRINVSTKFDENSKIWAIRIIKSLISSRSRQKGQDEAESRIDYLSDRLGIRKEDVIHTINLLREEKILADSKDITAYIYKGDTENKSKRILKAFNEVEDFLYPYLDESGSIFDLKEMNAQAAEAGLGSVNISRIITLLNLWSITGWISKKRMSASRNQIPVQCIASKDRLREKIEKRQALSTFIINYLYENAGSHSPDTDEISVEFSELAIKEAYKNSLSSFSETATSNDIEDALFYLSRIGAIKVEGGFLVIYNSMKLERLEMDNKKKYRLEEYKNLGKFYENRIQQIHIVGEYAKKMINDYKGALRFVEDYFQMDYSLFLEKYFRGRKSEISQNITPAKFRQIFGGLSASQLNIIKDNRSKVIVVAAGPGSGKTRVLVHKLASLLLMEDIKHEQLLMLTFSRAAATEFKQRLYSIIGNAAAFVEIKTFHSYCFDLLGRIGSIDESEKVVSQAVRKIEAKEVDIGRITKTVLVIDEAQDMDADEYSLVKALMSVNEDMRVIAVGDDDQNIYAFRGSDSRYMEELLHIENARKYDLVENFRSARNLVGFSNMYAGTIGHRLKDYDVVPVRQETGKLSLTRYTSRSLAVPVSDLVVKSLMTDHLPGPVAVLTRTNDEALEILGLLLNRGIPARLIQSNDGFNLSSMEEIKYFMSALHVVDEGAVICHEDWIKAKSELYNTFSRSDKMEICHNLISAFESTNRNIIYRTDFETFVKESRLEDFIMSDTSSVTVSTMHKVKGKEFGTVFIVLNNFQEKDDNDRRLLYVAMTRAKDNLSIHLNSSFLDRFTAEGLKTYNDNKEYGISGERTLLLSLRDIWLNDSAWRQGAIADLRSGDRLYADENECKNDKGQPVLKFSNGFKTKISALINRGYSIAETKVNFIVWWKGEDMDREIMIVLPKITFRL